MPATPWPPIVDDDGSGTTGTVLDNVLFTQIRNAIGSPVQDMPFNAGNLGATGGTWTVTAGNIVTYAWTVNELAKELTLYLYLVGTSVAGAPSSLNITIPDGRVAARQATAPAVVFAVSAQLLGVLLTTPGSPYVLLQRDTFGTAWTAGTGYYVNATMTIPI